jgi:type VI secretion system protein ImpG
LGLDDFACADPYVERLLEGFAFLAARVQLKIDAEFPRFTQSMLETVYPHYLAPTPSMVVVQVRPDFGQSAIDKGYPVPRGTVLNSLIGKDQQTPCKYLTAHEVTLRPLRVAEAGYHVRGFASLGLPGGIKGKAAVQIGLQCGEGRAIRDLELDEVVLFLRGGETAMRIYEQFFAHCRGVVARSGKGTATWQQVIDVAQVQPLGFEEDQALLPYSPRSFQGYRLLQEYFALPDRFMFVKISGLAEAAARCTSDRLDLFAVMDEPDLALENAVEASSFALHCTPAVNLFPHRADRVNISDRHSEVHVLPDRTRPLDFEVYLVTKVTGYGSEAGSERVFMPFYSATDLEAGGEGGGAYFVVNRVRRPASARVRERGHRSSYIGSEVYVSLVDPQAAPYDPDLRQLSMETLCTNRDLALHMPVGSARTDFQMEVGAPVSEIVCLSGPTTPKPSWAEGETSWRLISHLALNYLSVAGDEEGRGASRLRDMLRLYGDLSSPGLSKQIDGLAAVSSEPVVRRVFAKGPIAFARGLELSLTFDEACFEGTGVFLMGAVLERFLARHVSINSFTETVIKTMTRGEIMRWRPRLGLRPAL